MRLLEAIIEANQRAVAANTTAALNATEFADALPLVALTCIDPRLNKLVPEMLGVPEEQFIWLRNAGNIIFEPMSSMMRTLALACAVKGGKEIAIIGHSDCQVCKTTVMKLTDAFRSLGVDRAKLPENMNEFFGLFASERQNVLRGAEIVRQSPLIGSKVPVHGLLMDVQSGRLEWLVDGYRTMGAPVASVAETVRDTIGEKVKQAAEDALNFVTAKLPEFNPGEMKFPEFKIGETTVNPNQWLADVKAITAAAIGGPSTGSAQTPKTEPERKLDPTRKYRVIGADQKVYGPIDGGKILEWIADGRIDWQTPAQAEGSGEWKPLGTWADSPKSPTIPLPPPVQPAPQLRKARRR
ncbi:MAG TPA: carbonic anhydrase [Candidatus Angelobacter sp.]|nr:carbonic anhydrase [Candidatus Angelobacter sp.]